MKGQHVDPEEAVQIHMDLEAKRSLAIHWGTFDLACEVIEDVGRGVEVSNQTCSEAAFCPLSTTWSRRAVSRKRWNKKA